MLTPNWFASVMGTGIVAVAAARLPEQFPGLHAAAIVLWALAGILLLALMAATVAHWVLYALGPAPCSSAPTSSANGSRSTSTGSCGSPAPLPVW